MLGPRSEVDVDARQTRWVEVVIVGLFLALSLGHLWVAEDAFISFRFARNAVEGHGLVFNPGLDPVEGYSNFLWVLVGAVFEALGLRPDRWIHGPTLAAGVCTLLAVRRIASSTLGLSPPVALFSMAILATSPPFFTWATSGLEVMPQTALFLATAWGLAFGEGRRAHLLTAAAGLGLALIRTEGVLWLPVLLVLALAVRAAEDRLDRALMVRFTSIAGVGVVAFLLWRHATYGAWVSNTTLAKGSLSAGSLERGGKYVLLFGLLMLSPLLTPLVLVARRGRSMRGLWVLALAAACPAWAVLVGGDYMMFFRFLVPSTPFMALAAGVGVHALGSRSATGARLLAVVVLVVGFVPSRDVVLAPVDLGWLDTSTPAGWEGGVRIHRGRFSPLRKPRRLELEARALGAFTEAGEVVVTGAVGQLGYFNPDVLFLDKCGLVHRGVAAREVEVEADVGRRPGHDKCVAHGWFLDDKPDVLYFASLYDEPDPVEAVEILVADWRGGKTPPTYQPDLVVLEADVPGGMIVGLGLRRVEGEQAIDAAKTAFKRKKREMGRMFEARTGGP